jgi:4a-hydroxytetrahydrobiopterin dehydratase
MDDGITPRDFHESEGVEDWRVLGEGAFAFFPTESFAESAQFVAAVGGIEGLEAHPPAVDLRRDGVTLSLITSSDDYRGMSRRDVEMARRISEAARDLGLRADPTAVQTMLLVPGAPAIEEIVPFWRAVLGYEPRPDSPDEDLIDPRERGVSFWFESMAQPRPDGGGAIHVAVWVAIEQAEARVAAALAAGGHIVRDDFAPSWWTLADAAGNEADIATVSGRS